MAGLAYFVLPWISCWLVGRRRPMAGGLPVRILAMAVCWTVLQVLPVQLLATLQILGLIRRFSIPQLAGIQLLIFLAAAIWSMRLRPAFSQPPATRRAGPEHTGIPATLLVAGAAIGAAYAASAAELLLFYPSGSDALRYHFPLAVRWFQDGSLRIPPSGAWQFSLPANAEIGMMILLDTGKQSLATVPNWVAAAVCAFGSYVIARHVSWSRNAAAASTLIALSLLPVLMQTFSGYVDLYATAYFVASIALFLHRYDSGPDARSQATSRLNPAMLFLSSLACGISIGTKPVYFFYAGIYLICVLLPLMRERTRGKRPFLALGLLIIAGMLLPSAFWFARATYATGNPVYPLEVRTAGKVLLHRAPPGAVTSQHYEDEFVQSKLEWLTYAWTEWKRTPGFLLIPYGTSMGLGAVFATFVPLGLAFAVIQSYRSRRTDSLTLALLLLAWLAGLSGWWFFLRRILRFGMPLWILACCIAAPMFASLKGSRLRAFHVLLLIAILSTATLLAFRPMHSIAGRLRARETARSDFYSYPKALDELPRGSRLLNMTTRFNNFSLAGEELSNRVVADFEAPRSLNLDYLKEEKVDFIIESRQESAEVHSPPCNGLVLYRDGVLRSGEDGRSRAWRIWKVTEALAPR
jgi:hypothetical protein